MEQREIEGTSFITGQWPPDPEKTTLVFIHGAGGSSVLWENQVEGLKDRVNTVALDLPGHGNSRGPGKSSVADYANLVMEFINRAGAPRPVPVGLSMGGAITQQLVLDHGRNFPAAVLMSTGAKLKVLPLIFEKIQTDFPGFIDLMGKFSASEKTPAKKTARIFEDTAKREPEVVYNDFKACDAFDVMDRLGAIELPVLVITGSDDKLTPPKYGERLASDIKDAVRVHIEDAGHMLPVEKPEELNRSLLKFLSEQGLA